MWAASGVDGSISLGFVVDVEVVIGLDVGTGDVDSGAFWLHEQVSQIVMSRGINLCGSFFNIPARTLSL